MESNWLEQSVNDPDLQPAANAAWRSLRGLSENQIVDIWNKLDAILKPLRVPRRFGVRRGPMPRNDYHQMRLLALAHNSKLLELLNRYGEKVPAVLLLHLLHHDGEERAAMGVYGWILVMKEKARTKKDVEAGRKSKTVSKIGRENSLKVRKLQSELRKEAIRDVLKYADRSLTQEAKCALVCEKHPEILGDKSKQKEGIVPATILTLIKKERL